MRILKGFVISLLAIVCVTNVYGAFDSYGNCDYYGFGIEVFPNGNEDGMNLDNGTRIKELQSKVLRIMNMMDESKNRTKNKILSVMLEVDLDILDDKMNKLVINVENRIYQLKDKIYKDKHATRSQIMQNLKEMEFYEEFIQSTEDSLKIISAWKRQYCH